MSAFEAVTLYTGLFVALFWLLKMNCGRVRVATKVDFGEGDSEAMRRAMRIQGNAVEDVPIILLGLYGLAALSAPIVLIHILGAGFFVARILHALGLGGAKGFGWGRLVGTLGTVLTFLVTAGSCLWFALT